MDTVTFTKDFIKKSKPSVPFRYELLDEVRTLMELDRAEMWASTADERKREENETNKIIAALEKEKHDEFVAQKRHQQLMQNNDELRRLRYYVNTAVTAKELIGQLKLQDVRIEERFEDDKRQAAELLAEYRAAEERQRRHEEQVRREGIELCEVLKEQMVEHDEKHAAELQERIQVTVDLREREEKLLEQDRQELAQLKLTKRKLRKEALEFLEQQNELRKELKIADKNAMLQQIEVERRRDELQQSIKDRRQRRIRDQQALSAKIGAEVYKIEYGKRKAVTDLIDWLVKEKQIKDNLLHEQELEKATENRRQLQHEMSLHLERKEAEKEREHAATMELARLRTAQRPGNEEAIKHRQRVERERWDAEQYMKAKKEWQLERQSGDISAKRITHDVLKKQEEQRQEDIKDAANELLYQQPLPLLRYLPSAVVRSDYLPQPLCDQVRQEVRNNPIPLLTPKRHMPHLLRRLDVGGDLIKCCKSCPQPRVLSNIF